MRIGSLRNRIIVQSATETRDAEGGVIRAWAKVREVWGSIETTGGLEVEEADRMAARAMIGVVIRFFAGLTTRHRVVMGARTFNIRAVDDVDNRHREMRLTCVEVI